MKVRKELLYEQKKCIMIILTFITLICVLTALYFLPNTIALNFRLTGAGSVASKY